MTNSTVKRTMLQFRSTTTTTLLVRAGIFNFIFGKFGSPYLAKATTATSAALPFPNSACGIFVCPNEGMAANVWDL